MFKKKKNILETYFALYDRYPRHYFIFGGFFFVFCIIVSTVFSYTILDHQFYQDIADKQQIGEVKIPVTRGSILSSNENKSVFATSVNLDDLAIDPTQVGNKGKLISFLSSVIYDELCSLHTAQECKENVLDFLKQDDILGGIFDKEHILHLIEEELAKKISQKYMTSVLITQELEGDTPAQVEALHLPGVYVQGKSLYVNPEEMSGQQQSIAAKLSPLLDIGVDTVFHLIRRREIQYIPLLKKISIDQSASLKEYIKNEKESVEKGFEKGEDTIYKFLILSPNPHRFYPENKVASQVLGFTDATGVGHYGIEGYYNDILEGEAGEIVSRKDIQGRPIEAIDITQNGEDREGATITTTIDRNIQAQVEKILEAKVKEYRANKGSVVIMDPNTGKIIAMANYPQFDPNNPGDVYELERVNDLEYSNPGNELIGKQVFVEDPINGKEFTFDGEKILLRPAEREELGNRSLKRYIYKNDFGAEVYQNATISDLFEPGSIMKSFTMAVGIDSGEISPYDFYQNSGPIHIDDFKISDIASQCLGYHSFSHALNYSCNVGMVRIIQKVGKALWYNYLGDFGFGKSTDITIDGETALPMAHYDKWSKAQLYTTSYGLGISVNQLQMAVAYSALINGGLIYQPQIIDSIDFKGGKVVQFQPELLRRVIKKTTSDTMKELLYDSIENGVAKPAKVEGYALGGKTGTSQIAYKGGYEDGNMPGSTNGSFAGFGPVQDPKFVVVVRLNRPRTNNFGGSTSSHIFAEVAKYLLEYYQIPKLEEK